MGSVHEGFVSVLLAGLVGLVPVAAAAHGSFADRPDAHDRHSHRIAIEGGGPVYQWLRGPQLETDWRIVVGWQKAFRPWSLGPLR